MVVAVLMIGSILIGGVHDMGALVASIRHPEHVLRSAMMGADVGTMPFKVLQQLYKHPLTDSGLEKFTSDWKKTGKGFED